MNVDASENGWRMPNARQGSVNEFAGTLHAGGQSGQHGTFQGRKRSQSRMVSGVGEIDARRPDLAQRAHAGIHHAREQLDLVEFAQRGVRERSLQGFPKRFVVDGTAKSTPQPARQLLHGHDLKTCNAVARCGKSQLS
ncbi:MAG: hypothetical protein KKC79_14375 [Gammaproteobacteria bacterium]|nr:hypothetical protein [Gammaproteobacteria bacterium]